MFATLERLSTDKNPEVREKASGAIKNLKKAEAQLEAMGTLDEEEGGEEGEEEEEDAVFGTPESAWHFGGDGLGGLPISEITEEKEEEERNEEEEEEEEEPRVVEIIEEEEQEEVSTSNKSDNITEGQQPEQQQQQEQHEQQQEQQPAHEGIAESIRNDLLDVSEDIDEQVKQNLLEVD